MQMIDNVYMNTVNLFKLSKKNQKLLTQLIAESVDYWTVPEELKGNLRNEKLHTAFTYYTNETNQRDLTSVKLTQQEIKLMNKWVNQEYQKCKHRIPHAANAIIENIMETSL